MSTVLIVAIAIAGVVIVALAALRGNTRGFSWLASRMDSLERRMAAVEAYTRPKQPGGSPTSGTGTLVIAPETELPPMSGGNKPA